MRRADREVTEQSEILDIMARCQVLRIAINTDTVPYILPVNFGMEPDGTALYIHGAMTGTKYDLLVKDPRVSFEMDCTHGLAFDTEKGSCTMSYESVIGWGTITELTQADEKRNGLQRLLAHYQRDDFLMDAAMLARTRVLRLEICQMRAKRRGKLL